MPVPNRFDVVQDEFRQQPPAPGDEASWGEFTRRVARRLHAEDANWGLVTKQPGEGQHQGYAIDVIAYRTPYRQFDILSAGGWPNASPAWMEIDPALYRPLNVWAAPPPATGGGTPPPPPPSADCETVAAPLRARIGQLEVDVRRLEAELVKARPAIDYDDMAALVRDADAAYSRGALGQQQGDMPPMTTMHLFWRYFFEGFPRDALIEDARKRGNNDPFE